jgi:hypothetical protein
MTKFKPSFEKSLRNQTTNNGRNNYEKKHEQR